MSNQEFADFELAVDLAETKAWDGEQAPLVDPGEYTLQIVGFQHKTGNVAAMIECKFEIQTEGAWKGQFVYNNYSLSDKAIGRLKQLAVAVGASLGKIVASEYIGAVIEGTVYHSEGAAKIDNNGNTMPSRMFANVKNERAVAAAATTTKAATPPVQRTAPAPTQTKPATTTARRA